MDVSHFQRLLENRRTELARRLSRIDSDFQQPRSADDEERAIESENDEVLQGFGHAGQSELRAIDAALKRITDGKFGQCVRCGKPITERRLAAVPHTPFCQDCVPQPADKAQLP